MRACVQLNTLFLKVSGATGQASPLSFSDELREHPLTRLKESVLFLIREKLMKDTIVFKQRPDFCARTGAPLIAEYPVPLNAYLYSEPSVASFFEMDKSEVSLHGVLSGIFRDSDHNQWAPCHRILIRVDPAHFIRFIEEERARAGHVLATKHDEEMLVDYLGAVFREVCYGIEYIENSNGLPPSALAASGIDPYYPSFGIGTIKEVDQLVSGRSEADIKQMMSGTLFDMMEARIKARALRLFNETLGVYDDPSFERALRWIRDNAHAHGT